jgi:hypothetical protein
MHWALPFDSRMVYSTTKPTKTLISTGWNVSLMASSQRRRNDATNKDKRFSGQRRLPKFPNDQQGLVESFSITSSTI